MIERVMVGDGYFGVEKKNINNNHKESKRIFCNVMYYTICLTKQV